LYVVWPTVEEVRGHEINSYSKFGGKRV
jgi:hypothetical protein